MTNPYRRLPDHQFWRRSVGSQSWLDVDPVVETEKTFKFAPDTKVATAGSCFAQHIARSLMEQGYHYLITENPPAGDEQNAMYTQFSAAYGNIYTIAQLHQLMRRAYSLFHPEITCWQNSKGRFIDPFRPAIRPDGFETAEELLLLQKSHLRAVRRVFEECDVFIFTLGLTEGWCAKSDGTAVPLIPAAVDCETYGDLYEFKNASVTDMVPLLNSFLLDLHLINPNVKVILTVSPVSLIATYEKQNVILSNSYSKSALRVVAEELVRVHPFVSYFPSYEIISSHPSKGQFFEDDLRSVRPEGVAHVMRIFAKHHLSRNGRIDSHKVTGPDTNFDPKAVEAAREEYERNAGIICDEERLDV